MKDALSEVSKSTIGQTALLIAPHIRRTPIIDIAASDVGLSGKPITLKLELFQRAGSFKTRGAFANLLLREIPAVGVAAASGGNHGAAVAYAAMKLGVPAHIFVPTISSAAKVDRIRSYGAKLEVGGNRYADALEASERFISQSQALPIHAFDQVETLLGQGTLACELAEQAPDLDTLLISVGGGGLIAGIASWYAGRVRIVGVEPEGAPTLTRARAAGSPVDAESATIAADSLAPRRVGELVFPLTERYVHRVVLVDDQAIRSAQECLWDAARIVVEPGGAAALAALVSGRYVAESSERIGVIISGGNTVVSFAC